MRLREKRVTVSINKPVQEALVVAGNRVEPGEKARFEIPVAKLVTQSQLSVPVIVIRGRRPGPCMGISAAIHGDEINGVEIIRQVLDQIEPTRLKGTVIAVPVVNVFGFIQQSRYLPDRRDLNRSFPGSAKGSLASRLAHLFMTQLAVHFTHAIDLHTAATNRVNWPQIRANLRDDETRRLALAFAAPIVIDAQTRDGSLRAAAANRRRIPCLLYEAGEPLRFEPAPIQTGVLGVLRVMTELGMIRRGRHGSRRPLPQVSSRSSWVRARYSGMFHSEVALGHRVRAKQRLGITCDVFGEGQSKVLAPHDGMIIGMACNPLVSQGDGIVHLAELEADPSAFFDSTP